MLIRVGREDIGTPGSFELTPRRQIVSQMVLGSAFSLALDALTRAGRLGRVSLHDQVSSVRLL